MGRIQKQTLKQTLLQLLDNFSKEVKHADGVYFISQTNMFISQIIIGK